MPAFLKSRVAASAFAVLLAAGPLLGAGLSWQWQALPPLPDPEGFSGGLTGVSGDALLFAGGSNFVGKRPWEGGTKSWYDTVYVLTAPDARWKVVGKLPRPNSYGACVSYGGEMICVGGGSAHEHYRDVFALTWDGRSLHQRTLAPLPRPCSFTSATLAGHTLYVAGGIDRPDAVGAMNTFWSLDLADPHATWSVLAPVPGPGRMEPVMGTSGGAVYVFSGIEVRPSGQPKPTWIYLHDAYAYTPGQGWRRIADMPRGTAGGPTPAPTTPDGKLLLVSGDDGTRRQLDGPNHPGFPRDGFVFDPATGQWSPVPEGPMSRSDVPTVAWKDRWIIPGGERKPGYRSNEVWSIRLMDQ